MHTIVLGVTQDAGYPQAGCLRGCCEGAPIARLPACLGVVGERSRWMIECTPSFVEQLRRLNVASSGAGVPDGVVLTHAHIGHYAGLIHLGREAADADRLPVYVMPRMRAFLELHAPWEQLVRLGNIALRPLNDQEWVTLEPGLSIKPFVVPHRDEYSETVGYVVRGPRRSVAFLPDIQSWEAWGPGKLRELVEEVDVAYIDGTFFDADELPGRDLSKIGHPTVESTLQQCAGWPAPLRGRVRLIHLNHTNPLLNQPAGVATERVEAAGCGVAVEGEVVELGL